MKDLTPLITAVFESLIDRADQFRDLDAALGDGDLGETVKVGSRAIINNLDEIRDVEPGRQLVAIGSMFNRAAPSTFGALFAMGLRAAGKAIENIHDVGLSEAVIAGTAAMEAIRDRGGADVGDKTMLDALSPAVRSLRQSLQAGQDPARALDDAASAAKAGFEATAPMKAAVSRASWLGTRSVGQLDGGAAVVASVFDAAASWTSGP